MSSREAVLTRGRDSGRAMIEFVFLGVLMLVPMIYLVLTLAQLQAAAFCAATAAREAGRAYTTATTGSAAPARATSAARISFQDYGFGDSGELRIGCDGQPCLRPEGRITATATVTVRLPGVPDLLASVIPASVPVSATHVAVVDRFAGR